MEIENEEKVSCTSCKCQGNRFNKFLLINKLRISQANEKSSFPRLVRSWYWKIWIQRLEFELFYFSLEIKEDSGKVKKNPCETEKVTINGFTTLRDQITYLVSGTVFWITVMVVANFVTSHLNQFKPGHGSLCVRGFKECFAQSC